MSSKRTNIDERISPLEPDDHRRNLCKVLFTIGAIAAGVRDPINGIAHAEGLLIQRLSIEQMRRRIAQANASRNPAVVPTWNVSEIAQDLTNGLSQIDARRTLFNFVQSFPYRLRHWEPRGGAELYDEECGDCRHKRDALHSLYQQKGFEVRKVAVFFDWADLPIPPEILAIRKKSGTKGFHSGLDVKINGQWINVDATWDQPLAFVNPQEANARGCFIRKNRLFPVTTNWDGMQATKEVTNGSIARHPHDSYRKIGDLYTLHNVPWPDMEEVRKFNEAFNSWLHKIR